VPRLEAIVMAAGEGRRLRPLTEHWPKPVLPIDGRPLVATLLRELAAAGVTHATIVTGHLAGQVESLVGDGSAFGVTAAFARQPRADGSADAVSCALAAGASAPALVSAADTQYAPGDVGRFAQAFTLTGAAGAIAARRGLVPTAAKPGLRVECGCVVTVYDLDPELPFTSAPLWALGPQLLPYLEGLPGPPWELKDAYQRAVDDGLTVSAIEIGKTRDLTDPLDLVEENFPYLGATG
jgi:CTP:molybdopterin cytidylyltransferase MocA